MKRTPITILSLQGSPLEVAYQMGQRRRNLIEKRIHFWNERLSKIFQKQKGRLVSLETLFLREALSQASDLVEEIAAMAEGAGVPFADLFRLNLTEIRAYAEKCTTVISPVNHQSKKSVLLSHNEDWDPKRNDVFVLKVQTPTCSYAVLAYDGYLPGLSCGINSYGLAHALNYLQPGDIRIGLPRIFLTRRIVTARSIQEAIGFARKYKRAFGQTIHLAQGGTYQGLELTAKKVNLWKPSLPAIHTNHYLTKNTGPVAKPSRSSLERYKTASHLLDESPQTILSDRSGFPYAIWRDADCKQDTAATVATVMIDTAKRELQVYRRQSDRSRPAVIQL